MKKRSISKMKKHTIVAAASLVLALAACEERGEQFQVVGEISEAEGKMLYFEASALDGIKVLDSVKLDKKGDFAFRHKRPDGPEFYRLRIERQVVNLGIDSTEVVTVKGLLPSLATGYTVEGSVDSEKIKEICNLKGEVRLVITIGYAKEDDKLRTKKRKDLAELVSQF